MMVRVAMQLTVWVRDGTYICYTKERYEEGGNDDEEGELLSVLVEEFELIDEPRDHRFHPAHLREGDRIGMVRGWLWFLEVLTNIGLQGCVCVCICVPLCVYSLTALSMPNVNNIMKKITAHTDEPGRVAMASG